MIYLLGSNISEFSLNESMTLSNYEGIIEDLSDLIVKFTESWPSAKLTQFLRRLYEPPKEVFVFFIFFKNMLFFKKKTDDGESQYLFFKVIIHYFTLIIKKKYKNEYSPSEIKEFLRQWDRNHAIDSYLEL